MAIIPEPQVIDGYILCSLTTASGYQFFLDSLELLEWVEFAQPFYTLEDGTPLYIGQTIIAAFDSSITQNQIDSLNEFYGVLTVRPLMDIFNVIILLNPQHSGYTTVELANLYHNLPEMRYAHPRFGLRPKPMAYKLFDYYHGVQPHTKKVIGTFNSASVWDFAGLTRPVTIAVIDDGIDAHEDLPSSRILAGFNFAEGETDTGPGRKMTHGMACAGIIASSHTTDSLQGLLRHSGVISLAPNVKILPVNIFDSLGNSGLVDVLYHISEPIRYAYTHGADILSNSWGYGSPSFIDPTLTYELRNAYLFGRGGIGCPVIFASGNDADFYNGVAYPGNQNSCFAVGAVNLNDFRWTYSQYGAGLDVVAPSGNINWQGEVWSLDQIDMLGRNPDSMDCDYLKLNDTNYVCKFGGTYAACPVVSGVAALLLSKDSTLSSEAVYTIMRNSANTNLSSGQIFPPNDQYGWGRVDAFRAILSISRGDLNNDGQIGTVLDLNFLTNRIFRGGPYPFPSSLMGDCNCDGAANNIIDFNYMVNRLFRGGPPPVNPCFEF